MYRLFQIFRQARKQLLAMNTFVFFPESQFLTEAVVKSTMARRIKVTLLEKLENCGLVVLFRKQREPKLFQYARDGDWDLISDRTESHPKEAQFIHWDDLADTALHRIMRPLPMAVEFGKEAQKAINRMKLKAVVALLEAYPNALALQDSLGRTPLHLACMDVSNGGTEVVMMMIKAAAKDGEKACVPDLDGRTPLHYLVARNTFYTTELVVRLISLWPAAISLKDVVGDTPLDIASRRAGWSRPKEAFNVLVEMKHTT